jgi:predicted nucleic-acid-binding protein
VIALDTSVLARFILGDTPSEQEVAAHLIASNTCSVSWSVLVELCWVLERSARLPREEVIAAFATIASMGSIAVPDAELFRWAIDRYAEGADFPDMIHLASATAGSASFACFDRKLARAAGPDSPLAVLTLRA